MTANDAFLREWIPVVARDVWNAQRSAGRHPREFNAVLDGIADDTDAIRALHEWCNANNVPPSYKGVKTLAIQANAQIPINTDVDFCGADIRILGGIQPLDGWNANRNRLFIVADPDRPLVSGTVPVSGADFATGSYDSCKALIPGAGFVFFQHDTGTSLPRIAARDRLTSRPWQIANKVYPDLKTQWPMPVAATGLTQVFRSYRLNSAAAISIGNATFRQSDFNNQTLFDVQRNGVTVHDITLREGAGVPARSINGLIRIFYCCDVTLAGINGTNPNNDQSLGTYVVSADAAANVLIRDCNIRGGNWGWQVANFCNGLRFERCDVPRIDCHDYTVNIFASGCTLHERGVSIGHGGGSLHIAGLTFHQTRNDLPVLHGRPDYGRGSWDGDVIVDGFTVISKIFGGDNGNVIVDLGTNPLGNAEIPLTFPHSITVRNGTLQTNDAASGSTRVVMPVFLGVDPASQGVRSPRSIAVSDIKSGSRVAFCHRLDLSSCLAPLAGADVGCLVELVRLPSTHYTAGRSTILIPSAGAAPRVSKRVDVFLDACSLVSLSLPGGDYTGSKLRMRGGSLGRAVVPASFNLRYEGVDFDNPQLIGGETSAPICPAPTSTRYCSIVGGRLAGAYDLSLVHAIAGLATVEAAVTGAVLPSGVTRQQLFTGWIAA